MTRSASRFASFRRLKVAQEFAKEPEETRKPRDRDNRPLLPVRYNRFNLSFVAGTVSRETSADPTAPKQDTPDPGRQVQLPKH